MNSSFIRFALIASLSVVAAACNKEQAPQGAAAPAAAPAAVAAGPDARIMQSVHALRANDIGALLASMLPPAELAKVKADWGKEVSKDPVTDEDRRKFAEQMAKLTAPGAEDKLFAELQPQLKQFEQQSAQQMPMLIAMGQGFVQSAVQQNKELNDEQKKQTIALVDATAKWAQTAKFTDAALAKQAIGIACKAARDLNLKTLDEARALNFDQAMQKAGIVLAATKQVLALYGLQMDNALDSIKAQTVATTGDVAKVKVTYTAFGQPFSTESDLVRVDGNWYSKDAVEKWHKAEQQAGAQTTTPAADAPAATSK